LRVDLYTFWEVYTF